MISERSTNTLPHTNISRVTLDGQGTNFFARRVHQLSCVNQLTIVFWPPRSAYKKLFLGTKPREILQTMSFRKSVPEGLKLLEWEWGIGGKNSPIRYIPKKDPVQEAIEKNIKTNYFKLMLPHMGSKLKVMLWVSGTPEQFVLHVHSAIHACK